MLSIIVSKRNKDHEYITKVLEYYTNLGIDGYRFDVASLLPNEFYKFAFPRIKKINPNIILLAEAIEPEFSSYIRENKGNADCDCELYLDGFDLLYRYSNYSFLKEYLLSNNLKYLDSYRTTLSLENSLYPNDALKIGTIENHVEFSGKIFPMVDKVDEEFLKEPFLAIILDVGDKKRIADPRFKMAKKIIKIDHHPSDEHIAKVQICETEKSSCAEIVANFLLYANKKGHTLSSNAARFLYIGMVGDNGRFLYNSTSPFTFDVAAELVNTGLNITRIYEEMYSKTIKDLDFIKYVISNYQISNHGKRSL